MGTPRATLLSVTCAMSIAGCTPAGGVDAVVVNGTGPWSTTVPALPDVPAP